MPTIHHQQEEAVSPASTEELLLDYLGPQFERNEQEIHHATLYERRGPFFPWAVLNDTFAIMDEQEQDANITIELTSFSDLQIALKDIGDLEPTVKRSSRQTTTDEDLLANFSSTDFKVPPSVRLNIQSSQILDMLMARAAQHWCCIGFKVAPISVDLIKDWRNAPEPIVFCIASISLVTFMDQQVQNNSLYFKQAAMVFYEQARNKLDDILLDDMQPLIIQSYFCLSYTSNLLRLYEQQRTWGRLASISLQHLAEKQQATSTPIENSTLGCWFRWYYVDAWMCLSLNRESLLPDTVPWVNMDDMRRLSLARHTCDEHNLYSFAYLTWYMRRYIRALYSGRIFKEQQQQQKSPSSYYYTTTRELTNWYMQLPKYNTISELHLHLCYNSMRLVVLYQFLNPQQPPPHDIIIDCLETNLELLQALQHLKTLGCDQSTYHHMFFAIHNTAKRILQYDIHQFKHYAEEQLKINLVLLKSTQAYAHDVFKMKMYAHKIQDQFTKMKIALPQSSKQPWNGSMTTVFKQAHSNDTLKPIRLLPQQALQTVFKFEQQNKRKKSKQ